jgi:hypothetical protein
MGEDRNVQAGEHRGHIGTMADHGHCFLEAELLRRAGTPSR